MKRLTLGIVLLVVMVGLTTLAVPASVAQDDATCYVDANGQIVCQEGVSTGGGGNANTCTIHPEDGSGLPECGTPKDNECYPGGVLAGKCVSEWHWKGGWWLARFYHFGLSRADFPLEFASLLPPLPGEDDGIRTLPSGCFDHVQFPDTMFIGPPDTLNNSQDMNSVDGSCTGGVLQVYTAVIANSQPDAVAKCTALGAPTVSVDNFLANGYTISSTGALMPPDLYWCYPFP